MSNKNFPVIFDIKYHLIWHTKGREPVLTGGVKVRLKEILEQDCKYMGISILGGNIGISHVHMMLSCPPKLSASQIIQKLKGRSSRLLNQEFSSIKGGNPSDSFWEIAYFCHSFGEVSEEALDDYIKS